MIAKVLFAHSVSDGAADTAPAIISHCESAARAVLAALSEAGVVEYGVVLGGDWYAFHASELGNARAFANFHGGQLSQRTKAGPWTAVE